MKLRLPQFQHTFILSLVLFVGFQSFAQKPKKLLANGYYEQAFVESVKKQNKKVKLKSKYTDIIYKSYDQIYEKGNSTIASSNFNWQVSYDQLMRVAGFRNKVKHPGVYDKLKNIFYDENVLGNMAVKFNQENQKDLDAAAVFENDKKYFNAFDMYKQIELRQKQAKPITTFNDRLKMIDTEEKIKNINQLIGDEYVEEAGKLLFNGTKEDAKKAIDLLKKAKTHRDLSRDEEEMMTLANLILRDSWMQEAKTLMQTRTKRNGRLAYDLINKTRSIKPLTTEEEMLLQDAQKLGMTNVLVVVKGKQPIHTAQTLSGVLNKEKASPWISFYGDDASVKSDFVLTVTESQPRVILGDVRKRIEQRTKTVEYYEEEIDANGNKVKVKKTKQVTGMVAILSRTKSSYINWSIALTDKADQQAVYADNKESKIERINEFASLESGDIMALPENIESDVALDSQPFPTDKEMSDLVSQLYIKELRAFLKDKEDHLRNIDVVHN